MKHSILPVMIVALALSLTSSFAVYAGGGDEVDSYNECANNCWNPSSTAASASCAKSCGPAPKAAFNSNHERSANEANSSVLTLHCIGSMQTTQLPDGRIVPFRIPMVDIALKPSDKTLTFTSGRANYQTPFTPPADERAGVEESQFQIRELTELPQFPAGCISKCTATHVDLRVQLSDSWRYLEQSFEISGLDSSKNAGNSMRVNLSRIGKDCGRSDQFTPCDNLREAWTCDAFWSARN